MKQISVSYGFYLSISICVSRDSCAMETRREITRSVESKTVRPKMLASRVCDCVYLCDSVCSIHTENDYCGSYCIIMNEQTSKQASKHNTDPARDTVTAAESNTKKFLQ